MIANSQEIEQKLKPAEKLDDHGSLLAEFILAEKRVTDRLRVGKNNKKGLFIFLLEHLPKVIAKKNMESHLLDEIDSRLKVELEYISRFSSISQKAKNFFKDDQHFKYEESIDANKECLFYLNIYSVYLQKFLLFISEKTALEKYVNIHKKVLNSIKNQLEILESLGVSEVDKEVVYSIDCEAFVLARKNSEDDFNRPFNLRLGALKERNQWLLTKLEIRDYPSFQKKQETFVKLGLAWEAPLDHIPKLESAMKGQNLYKLFIPHLLLGLFNNMYEDICQKDAHPVTVLCHTLPNFFQFCENYNINDKFFESLAELWLSSLSDVDPFFSNFNLYTPLMQLALMAQLFVKDALDNAKKLDNPSFDIVNEIYKYFMSIITFQRDVLSFFEIPNIKKKGLNGWLFFDEDKKAYHCFLPNYFKKTFDETGNFHVKPKISSIPSKEIINTANEIIYNLDQLNRDKLKFSNKKGPEEYFKEIQDIIYEHNIILTKIIWNNTKLSSVFSNAIKVSSAVEKKQNLQIALHDKRADIRVSDGSINPLMSSISIEEIDAKFISFRRPSELSEKIFNKFCRLIPNIKWELLERQGIEAEICMAKFKMQKCENSQLIEKILNQILSEIDSSILLFSGIEGNQHIFEINDITEKSLIRLEKYARELAQLKVAPPASQLMSGTFLSAPLKTENKKKTPPEPSSETGYNIIF